MTVSSHWLQLMTDVVGNPEEERRAAFYHEPWSQEAVSRYFYCKVRKRLLIPDALASKNTPIFDAFSPFFFFFIPTDSAEETGAGTGLSCPQHLRKGPSSVSANDFRALCVCVYVCVCVCVCV